MISEETGSKAVRRLLLAKPGGDGTHPTLDPIAHGAIMNKTDGKLLTMSGFSTISSTRESNKQGTVTKQGNGN